jgi:hypothetical protein
LLIGDGVMSSLARAGLRSAPTKENRDDLRRVPVLARVVALFSLAFTLMIASVMAIARISPPPPVLELPQAYLPGSPFPVGLSCREESTNYQVCSLDHMEYRVYAVYDQETRLITGTVVQTQAYMISQLVLAWGTPSGVTWGRNQVTIYWGMRSALIYDHSLSLDTRVDFVIYRPDALAAEPWRGFRRRKNPP